MADLAFVFGWTPTDMHDLDVRELMDWHAKALRRHNPPKKKGE